MSENEYKWWGRIGDATEEEKEEQEEEDEEPTAVRLYYQRKETPVSSENLYDDFISEQPEVLNSIPHPDLVRELRTELRKFANLEPYSTTLTSLLNINLGLWPEYEVIQTKRPQKDVLTFSGIKDFNAYRTDMFCDVGCATRTLEKIVPIPDRLRERLITAGGLPTESSLFLMALFDKTIIDPRLFMIDIESWMFGYALDNPELKSELKKNPERLREYICHRIIQLLASSLGQGCITFFVFEQKRIAGHAVAVYKLVDSEIMMVLDYQQGKASVLDLNFFKNYNVSEVTLFLDVKKEYRGERPTAESFWDSMRRIASKEFKPESKKRKTIESMLAMIRIN